MIYERHGMFGTPTYNAWRNMKTRCTNPSADNYEYYGGRGITVCEEWMNSFTAFYNDMGEVPDGYELDREDTDGNYEPGNCRWVTPPENRANRRLYTLKSNDNPMKHIRKTNGNQWEVRVKVRGKCYIERTVTLEEAQRVRDVLLLKRSKGELG